MRFPFRSQLESSDCGPACIQMVAAYFGKRLSLSVLKEYCNVTRVGVSLKDVLDGCRRIGLRAVPLQLTVDKLKEMPLPAILYWKQEHFVVLHGVSHKKGEVYYHIADPNYGKIKLKESLFTEAWTSNGMEGVAVALEPLPAFFEQKEDEWTLRKWLHSLFSTFSYLKKYKRTLYGTFLLSVLTFGIGFLIPFFLQKVMDEGIGQKDMHWVIVLLAGQLALYIGKQISTASNNYLLYHTGLKVGLDISTRYVWKLVKLPVGLFDTKLGTDFLQRLSDEQTIRSFLTYTASSLLFVVLNLLVYSLVLCYYNIYIFLVFLLFSALSFGLVRWLMYVRKQLNYAIFAGLGKKRNLEHELVYGMLELKINVAHHPFLSRWEKLQKELNKQSLKSLFYESGISTGNLSLATLRDTMITGICAWLVIQETMSVGVMMTITYILGQLSSAFGQMTSYGNTAQDAALAYKRMEDILNETDENDARNNRLPSTVHNGFTLEHVSFKYDGSFNPYVLKDVNIDIPLGKVTAIVGASGSGKTTLLKLLLSFYYPQEGNIYIDGMCMNRVDVDSWRTRCGVVMQDGYIFSGSVAYNMALEDDIDTERLKKAAQIACIDEFIERLPMKYHTKIGKAGMDLSGGQKQRILIARAVYKNPDFIFFDEATSSLDAENERVIMDNLKQFYQDRTVVIIAHRLSTVKDADNIIVLDKGCVAEQGNHRVLTEKQGLYYHLVKNQLELGQ